MIDRCSPYFDFELSHWQGAWHVPQLILGKVKYGFGKVVRQGYGDHTNEQMHASVRVRREAAVWNPKALEGFRPAQVDGGRVVVIPESHLMAARRRL